MSEVGFFKFAGKGYTAHGDVCQRITKMLMIGRAEMFYGYDDSEPQLRLFDHKRVYEERYTPPGHQTPLTAEKFLRCHSVHRQLKLAIFRETDLVRSLAAQDIIQYIKEHGFGFTY